MINVSELDKNIKKLVQYGINSGLIPESERNYSTNMILDAFGKDDYSDPDISGEEINLDNILDNLLDIACEMKLIEDSITYRDLFDTKLMNCLLPRPAQIQREFKEKYDISPEEATKYYYKLSQNSDYIRRYRVKKDMKWTVDSLDWVTKDTEKIVEKVTADTKEGDVILMHDCYGESVEAALQIVDIMEKQGYEFVTADELIIN